MGKLSTLSINEAIKKRRDKPQKLSDGEGLFLLISPTGSASWKFDYRFNGIRKTLTIGKYDMVSLREARGKLAEAKKKLFEGIDPAHEKQEEKREKKLHALNTFRKVFVEWHREQLPRWSDSHAARVLRDSERYFLPQLGNTPIVDITPPLVHRVIKSMMNQGLGNSTTKALQRINSVMDYAVRVGILTMNPILSLRGVVVRDPVVHRLALPEDELTEFFRRLEKEKVASPIHKRALLLIILTFVRVGSLRQAQWKEFDFEEKVWNIPAEHMKGRKGMKKPLLVPLSDWAIEILEEIKRIRLEDSNGRFNPNPDDYVFFSRTAANSYISDGTLTAILGKLGYKGKATVHGFRSLATDILNKHNFKSDIIERQMAHTETNSVRRAYHREEYIEERKEMMQWYSDWIRQYYIASQS